MAVYEIDPIQDARWADLLKRHPRSSVFHTPEWLEALRRTYDYAPIVLTTTPSNSPLRNGIVFCLVKSWLTRSRIVSVPFSDHCEPLVDDAESFQTLLSNVRERTQQTVKYAEIRPRFTDLSKVSDFEPGTLYCLHVLDMRGRLEDIRSRLHKNSVERKIRRAERENVVVVKGRSESLLKAFYNLLLLTRRRHRLFPQPYVWFRNLADCLDKKLTIYLASQNERPIAGILTLRHKDTLVYKYGCSDSAFHQLGGMPFLFWTIIEEAKAEHIKDFDLGRSTLDNPGLIRFKGELGATSIPLKYFIAPGQKMPHAGHALPGRMVQRCISALPDSVFRLAGQLLYRHAG